MNHNDAEDVDMTGKWKVEWLDDDGYGHVATFKNERLATEFLRVIRPISMMADIYHRGTIGWNRR